MKKFAWLTVGLAWMFIGFNGCSSSNNSSSPTSPAAPTNTPAGPTSTPSNTPVNSPTSTPSQTATNSATRTTTLTPTATPTNTVVNTDTKTATSTVTSTLTNTATVTPSGTPTMTATNTTTPICTFQPTSALILASDPDNTSGTAVNLGTLSGGDIAVQGYLDTGANQDDWFQFTAGPGLVQATMSLDCFDDGTGTNKFRVAAETSSLVFIVETSGGGVPSVQSSTFAVTPGQTYYLDAQELAGTGKYRLIVTGILATPTATPSSTPTASGPTNTPTNTPTQTPTSTITNTPVFTFTPSATATPTATKAWRTLGNAGFGGAGSSLYLSVSSGNDYLAYVDGANSGEGTVQQFSTSWNPVYVAGFTTNPVSFISIAPEPTGLFAAFQDQTTTYPVVEKYTSSWATLSGMPAHADSSTAMAYDAFNNVTYLVFSDGSVSGWASALMYNGSSWSAFGTGGFSDGPVTDVSLAVYNGTPYVSFIDIANGYKAKVMYYDGALSNWNSLGSPDFSSGAVSFLSMDVRTGTPYVAYSDQSTSGQVTVEKFTAGNWSSIGTGISPSRANYVALAVTGTTPYVGFQDTFAGNKLSVMTYNGSWSFLGGEGLTTNTASNLSMDIGNGSAPYVAFSDGNYGGSNTVMYYQ